ncbi:MAG: DNA topoisomerase VI subunit B [Euryarchaeota archaeon]|nr:DNA topoisomerase VI subunit B [Euryarchaeota archaeon]
MANGVVVHNSGVTLFSQMSTGKPTYIKTGTGNGTVYELKVLVDVEKNEGRIIEQEQKEGGFRGTQVKVEVKDVQYVRGERGPLEYIKKTAIANPHAKITFYEPDNKEPIIFDRLVKEVPEQPEEISPHPRGLTADDLLYFANRTNAHKLGTFLMKEFSRISGDKVYEIAKISKVDMEKEPTQLNWEDAERIIKAFQRIKFIAPSGDGLRPIGEEVIKKGQKEMLNAEFVAASTRKPKTYRGGIPFLIEAGIAHGGNAGHKTQNGTEMEIMRFANRVPLTFDAGACAITEAVNSIDWKRYGIKTNESAPISIFVNLVSTFVPYISAGKQAVSAEDEILHEIKNALMDVARELQIHLSRKVRAHMEEERMNIFEKYLPVIADEAAKLAEVKNVPDVKPIIKKIVKQYEEMETHGQENKDVE